MIVTGQASQPNPSNEVFEIFGEKISKEELGKITATAKRVFDEFPAISMTVVSLTPTKKARFVSHKKGENKKFFLVEEETEVLGKGNFMQVKGVRTFSLEKMTHKDRASMVTAQGELILIPKDSNNDDITHHNSILSKIHQNGYVPGFVKPNRLAKNAEDRFGIFMTRYEGSLSDCCANYDQPDSPIKKTFPLLDFLKGCRVLLEGLKYIHSLGIYHRDIKPANILYSGTKLAFTDFAGSRTTEKIKDILAQTDIEDKIKCSKISGTTSPLYTNFGDKDSLGTLINRKNLSEISNLFEKADIYAFGKTIFEIITKKAILWGRAYRGITVRVIHEGQDHLAFMKLIHGMMKAEGCSNKLIQMIQLMVEPFYVKRISSSEALVLLETVIKELGEPNQKK